MPRHSQPLSPPLFRPVENLAENDRLAERVGIGDQVQQPGGERGGNVGGGPDKVRRLVGRRRRRRLARHRLQLAHAVVEHLLQVLVDLLVGLGDLLAQLVLAAA